MASRQRTIVIVGAGFSGTALAVNLLTLPHESPVRVVLVERSGQFARGAAYAERDFPYLLNVPAGRMSMSPANPRGFLTFAQRSLPGATAEDFLPRKLYGRYLESALSSAAEAASSGACLEQLGGEVVGLERPPRTQATDVHLRDGRSIRGDAVVLALGNPSPAALPAHGPLPGGSCLEDPWQAPAACQPGETVLMVGTGLTMADVTVATDETARGKVRFHAISRHGLLPAAQTAFGEISDATSKSAALRAASVSVRRLVRTVRELSASAERAGEDWRGVITLVRGLAPAIWQRFSRRDRGQFLRHVRSYWDIHRHRLPDLTWTALNTLRHRETLQVHAGRICALERAGAQVRAVWRPRGARAPATLLVDRVINCTGPDYDARRTREPLLQSLIAQGMAVADSLGIGVATADFGALIAADGRASASLFCLGPLQRPRFWESTAVPELRVHAQELARHLARA